VKSSSQGHGHQHSPEHPQEPLTATSGFLALVALSIHAVTEGLAIGLQSSTTNVFFLLTAVWHLLATMNILQNTTVQILRFALINLLSLFVSAWK
jgi:zinc transporter ZupT